MKIVNFSTKEFREIPQQDNPAYIPKSEWDKSGQDGCLLIVKQDERPTPYVNAGRIVVLRIKPVEAPDEQESVWHLGLFWDEEHALMFCKAFLALQNTK